MSVTMFHSSVDAIVFTILLLKKKNNNEKEQTRGGSI